jgi:hypothetical protein
MPIRSATDGAAIWIAVTPTMTSPPSGRTIVSNCAATVPSII